MGEGSCCHSMFTLVGGGGGGCGRGCWLLAAGCCVAGSLVRWLLLAHFREPSALRFGLGSPLSVSTVDHHTTTTTNHHHHHPRRPPPPPLPPPRRPRPLATFHCQRTQSIQSGTPEPAPELPTSTFLPQGGLQRVLRGRALQILKHLGAVDTIDPPTQWGAYNSPVWQLSFLCLMPYA